MTTATRTRTDIHAPTGLVTEDYTYVASFDNELPPFASPRTMTHFYANQQRLLSLVATSTSAHRGLTRCHHCGASIRYIAILRHTPTSQHIAVGETCLSNRFERATTEFQALRKQAALDAAEHRIRAAVAEFLDAHPDLAFMGDKDYTTDNTFIADVACKLRRYGSLSERQVEAVRESLVRDEERAKRDAQRAAEIAAAAPVPTGRIVIEGEVVGIKVVPGFTRYDPPTTKLTIKADAGWRVWVTCPSGITEVERGNRVRLTATVEASEKDPTFGFGKRPTKAEVVGRAA